MKKYLVISLISLMTLAYAIYPQRIPVPEVKISIDKPAGSFYPLGSYIRVYLELDMPSYIRLYAIKLDGKKELLYPKTSLKEKIGPGKVGLGAFRTSLTGLVYLQVFAYTDTRYLDTFKKLDEAGMLKLSKLVFPHGADVTYLFKTVKTNFGRVRIFGSGYVSLDDKLKFKAPRELFLPVGRHWISYKLENRTFRKEFYVGKNALVELKISPTVQVKTHRISVSSTPSGAMVFLDGNYVGKTPFTTSVKEGFHAIRIEMVGYETYEVVKEIKSDLQLNVSLNRARSVVTFDSNPKGARVFVNGEEVGTTPVEIELYRGCYNVVYVMTGYRGMVFDACVMNEKEIFSFDLTRIE